MTTEPEWYFPTVRIVARKIRGTWCVGSVSGENTPREMWVPIKDFDDEESAKKYIEEHYYPN